MSKDLKLKIIEALKSRGIDPLSLEKELITLLRKETSSIKIYEYIKKLLESGKA